MPIVAMPMGIIANNNGTAALTETCSYCNGIGVIDTQTTNLEARRERKINSSQD